MAILEQLERQGLKPTRLTAHSRRVQPGDVFVAYPGAHVDGRRFIAQAVANGAAAVLAEAGLSPAEKVGAGDTAIIEVSGLAALSGEMAHLVYGRPSEHLWLAGVTGTNGKHYGGEVAAPVFAQIMAGSLRTLGVAPDAPLKPLLMTSVEPVREEM